MVADAKRDILSVISIPLTSCVGWGSEVPSEWTAVGCFEPTVFFVKPTGDTKLIEKCLSCYDHEDEVKMGECKDKRCGLVVEGYFTGKEEKAGRHSGHDPAYEFEIQRAKVSDRATFTLRLPGGSPGPDGLPIDDGEEWGVMIANAFMTDEDPTGAAKALMKKLVEAGHESAHVVDSRQITTLWCCSKAVLIDVFEGKSEASELAKKLKKQGFDDIIVRKLY